MVFFIEFDAHEQELSFDSHLFMQLVLEKIKKRSKIFVPL
jgi:hypothetical protein